MVDILLELVRGESPQINNSVPVISNLRGEVGIEHRDLDVHMVSVNQL